jgi:hypothetical protein
VTLCSEPHPEHSEVLCDKPAPCFEYHANAPAQKVWPGTPMPPRPEKETSRAGTKTRLVMMADRAR